MTKRAKPLHVEPRVSLYNGKLTIDLVLPEYHTQACVSRGGVMHLHLPHASASVCGRQAVGRAVKRDQEPVFSMQVLGARSVCPYCLAWAQGASDVQKVQRRRRGTP